MEWVFSSEKAEGPSKRQLKRN